MYIHIVNYYFIRYFRRIGESPARMTAQGLGPTEAVSIALGGMIGGGIYAVPGVVTAAFNALGNLGAITSFASLAFIVVFWAMSPLCLRERDHGLVHPLPPAVGLRGTSAFLPLMAYDLSTGSHGRSR